MTVTPIISWREAEFVKATTRALRVPSPAVADRAGRAGVHHPAPVPDREGVRREERVPDVVPHARLAPERSHRRTQRLTAAAASRWTSVSPTKSLSSRVRAAAWASPARGRWSRKGARCASAREARNVSRKRRSKWRPSRASRAWCSRCRPTCRTPAGVERVIDRTVETFGGVDILVNNVGKAGGADLLDTSDAEWQAAIDETLFPAIRASRLAVPLMRQRGGGVIVLIASIWGRESGGRMTYNAVKAAEISLGKALAQQLAPQNIRVNSVAPGRSCSRAARGIGASRPIPRASRIRQPRAAVRPLRPGRRGRGRRRIPRLAARQLGERRLRHGRRLPITIEYLAVLDPLSALRRQMHGATNVAMSSCPWRPPHVSKLAQAELADPRYRLIAELER